MTDFLARVTERALGMAPVVQPLVTPRFAPEPAPEDAPPEEGTIRHERHPEDRSQLRRAAPPTASRLRPRDAPPPRASGELASWADPEGGSVEEPGSPEAVVSPPVRERHGNAASGTPELISRTDDRPESAPRTGEEPRQPAAGAPRGRREPEEPTRAGEPPPASSEPATSHPEVGAPVPPQADVDAPASSGAGQDDEGFDEGSTEGTPAGREEAVDERHELSEPVVREGTAGYPPSLWAREVDAPLVPVWDEPAGSVRARSRREEVYTGRLEPDGSAASREAPIVRVSIGRVEVRATFSQPESRPREPSLPQPRLSLEEYLRSRTGETSE